MTARARDEHVTGRDGRCALGRNERGAMALITVFMAVFALAILYSFVGNIEAVFQREGLQDAADAAAMSAAVIHARGMNVIVLINIVMAALLAILITIKLIEALCILGMVIAAALAWPTFGASLALIPPLKAAQSELESSYQSMKEPIDTALKALNATEYAIRVATPLTADGIVSADIMNGGQKPADAGVAVGSSVTEGLPLENDSFSELCKRGGEELGALMGVPIGLIDPTGLVAGALVEAGGAMASTFQGWFCGGGQSSPPTIPRNEARLFPRNPAKDRCEMPESGDSQATQESYCEESRKIEAASDPDRATGACGKDSNCLLGGDYETRVADARKECDPALSPAPTIYWYEQRHGTVEYVWDAKLGVWKRGEPHYLEPVAIPASFEGAIPAEARQPPCGPEQVNPRVAVGYNLTVRTTEDVNDVLPVCSSETRPQNPPGEHEPTTLTLAFDEVVHLLGCQKTVRVELKSGDGPPPEGGDDRSPQRVKSGVSLGEEQFLLRSLMHGTVDDAKAGRVVRLALHHHAEGENPLAPLRELGDFSFAEAEYFYDGTEAREDWMWNMKWRARMRRFRFPEGGVFDGLGTVCSSVAGGACSETLGRLQELQNVIAH